MKKLLRFICVVSIGAFVLTGCGDREDADGEVMTAKEFKTIMAEKGFSVVEQTESAADSSYQQIYVAVDENKYSFEYYFMKDPNSATRVFDYAKDNLAEIYGDVTNAQIDESGSDTDFTYSVSAADYYCEVIQRENAVLYVTSYPDYKDEAKTIMKELGY